MPPGSVPPGAVPPGSVPPGYPVYQPAPAPARRRPIGLIVGGAALVLAALVIGGVAASAIMSKPVPSPELPVVATPAPSVAVVRPTPRPTDTPPPVVTPRPVVIVTAPPVVETPAPDPTERPAEPTNAPRPTAAAGGQLVSVSSISVTVSEPWTLSEKTDLAIHLSLPKKGFLSLVSGKLRNPTTPEAWIDTRLAENQKTDPNAAYCGTNPGPQPLGLPNGPAGKAAVMCYTVTPQGGKALKLAEVVLVGVDQAGTTLFLIDITATEEKLGEVLTAADGLLPTVTWALFTD